MFPRKSSSNLARIVLGVLTSIRRGSRLPQGSAQFRFSCQTIRRIRKCNRRSAANDVFQAQMSEYKAQAFNANQPSLRELRRLLTREQLESETWQNLNYSERATFLRNLWKLASEYVQMENKDAQSNNIYESLN